uniref:CCHC-type domain-containing protein n=1 Tax=Tanacetum cinerariifolium TaxID=118510 RepID=A0A6L2MF93_TANCI|nr:hypothetical protein [Tanacetum cinerariifolium]
MNQNFYNSNSSGFDQTKTPQFPIVHPPHQETSIEILHDQENQNKPKNIQELFRKLLDDLQTIHEELAEFINSPGGNRPAVYDDDDDDVDYTIAITPVLSTKEPDNTLSMGDEHLDTILVMESDKVIKSSVEDLVPIPSEPEENIEYVEASPHDSEFVSLEVEKIVIPKDEEIEDDNPLKDNPTPSSEFLTKSSSTSPKPFLDGTNTFHNSLPEFENFYFDLEEISSGSTTTHSDISLSEFEAFSFYDDHIEEIRSGSTTTHSDISLPEYEDFSFYDDHIEEISSGSTTTQSDFTHEEFGDELAHIISPPEYECFYIRNLPDPGELTFSLNSKIRKNLSSTTRVNLPVEDDYSPLLAYVVWIFLAYLTYPAIPPYLYSFGNEDTIFDPGITINRSYSFKPGLSHRGEKQPVKIASQSLEKLIGSQITKKSKRGSGYVSYNAVPPPHTRRFSPPRIDLSHTGLPEFAKPIVDSYRVKPIEVESEGEDDVKSSYKIERKTVKPSVDKSNVPSSVADETITKEMHDGLRRATTTASSLEAKEGNISRSREGSMQLLELMNICTKLSDKERMSEEIDEDKNVNLVKSSKQGEAHETAGHRLESDDTEVVDFSTARPQKDDEDGKDVFMLVEKEYLLSRGALLVMLIQKLQVDEHNKIAEELLRKIFMQDVIENGNSLKLVAQTVEISSTPHIPGPMTADEKIHKKNDVKASSMLLMALPNEHLMTFNQYKDAKSLFIAITTRFCGNDATKMTQKTLLKQMYENFSAQSTENKSDLDKIIIDDLYNNFKIVKQELKRNVGLSLSSGSPNMAFVSTPSTSNNDDVSTVFGVSASISQVIDLKWQLALLSKRAKRLFQETGEKITINGSDTNGYDKAKVECFNCHKMGHFVRECRVLRNQENRTRNQETTRRTVNVEDTSSKAMVAIDGAGFDWSYMSDDEAPTNMAFMAFLRGLGYVRYNVVLPPYTRRYSPPRIDLSHIGLLEFAEPSVESYGVKPIKVVTQTSSVKIYEPVKENNDAPLIEDSESEREDEVESPPEIERKNVEPSVDKERMVNGTNHLRMNHSANTVPKAVLTKTGPKPVNTVRPVNPNQPKGEAQQIWLILILDKKMIKYELSNSLGLASVEEKLVRYKKNESLLNENIAVLKRDILIKDSKIVVLKSKLEKISKEKDDIEIKIKKFENASQSLDKLIGSQITNKSKRGLGYVSYNAVPPPHTGRFSPLRIDLSHTGLPEFAEPSVESYRVKPIVVVSLTSSVQISKPVKENNNAPLIEDWESEGEDDVKSSYEIERKTIKHSVDKVEVDIPKQNDKPARRPVKYAEMYRT